MFVVISQIRLEEGRVKARKDGVLLACHELNRKFLVPLLLESVHKYQLFDQFQATVKGNMHCTIYEGTIPASLITITN